MDKLIRIVILAAETFTFCLYRLEMLLVLFCRSYFTIRIRESMIYKSLFHWMSLNFSFRINYFKRVLFFVIVSVSHTTVLLILLFSVPSSAQEVNDPDNIGYVPCPKGETKKVNKDNPYHGSYVRCEDFNRFFELLESGRIEQAGKLLLKPMKPDRKKKLKPFKFRHTPWEGEEIIISDVEKV